MISHRHRCIFVHQRKCAGTSIIRAFGLNPEHPDWHVANNGVLDAEFADLPRDYFRFSIVRNPWDRFVSGWKYCAGTRQRTLREVLDDLPAEGHDYRHLTRPQSAILFDAEGRQAVHFIMRYERLQADFDQVCARLGMAPILLPRTNAGQRHHYRDYFDAETRDLLARHFAEDIERFGYRY